MTGLPPPPILFLKARVPGFKNICRTLNVLTKSVQMQNQVFQQKCANQKIALKNKLELCKFSFKASELIRKIYLKSNK